MFLAHKQAVFHSNVIVLVASDGNDNPLLDNGLITPRQASFSKYRDGLKSVFCLPLSERRGMGLRKFPFKKERLDIR